MDDPMAALALSFMAAVLIFTCGVFILGGVLLFLFCKHVLPPLIEVIGEGLEWGAERLAVWWREVTWKRRMIRAHNEAVRQIEATRREHVARTYALVDLIERHEMLTAGETPAVRVAVRSAVRPR